jgi:hypothetical protein
VGWGVRRIKFLTTKRTYRIQVQTPAYFGSGHTRGT